MSDTRLRRDALLILKAFRNVEILTSLEIGDGGTRALSGAFVEREPEHMHGILNINLKRYSRTADFMRTTKHEIERDLRLRPDGTYQANVREQQAIRNPPKSNAIYGYRLSVRTSTVTRNFQPSQSE